MAEGMGAPLPVRESWFGRLTQVMNAGGSCLILLIMAVIVIDVIGRGAFNSPLPGAAEIVAMSIAAIVFLQFPSTLRARRVIMSDGFIGMIGKRSPALEQGMYALYHLIGGLLFALVARSVWPLVMRAYAGGEYYGQLALFTFPRWPVYGLIFLGSAVMAAQYLILAWQYMQAARRGERLYGADDATDKVIG